MTVQAHTPGPWTFWSNEHGAWIIQKGEGTIICQRNDWDTRAAESIGNGRLFYAAPDMLTALRIDELLYTVGFNRLAAEQIGNEARTAYAMGGTLALRNYGLNVRRAAIAKAEGRP